MTEFTRFTKTAKREMLRAKRHIDAAIKLLRPFEASESSTIPFVMVHLDNAQDMMHKWLTKPNVES